MKNGKYERTRFILLIFIMATTSLLVAGITITILYHTAFEEERARLVETAQSQARLIEAVARYDIEAHQKYHPSGHDPAEATLSQIVDGHKRYRGFGETGEFTLARREGDYIIFLLSHRHYDFESPKPVNFRSELAEPSRRALSGKSGSVIGIDYRGEKVLAAHEPVAELNWGIVAKIDMAEIRTPFMKAGLIAISITFLFVLGGAGLFLRTTNPIIRRIRENEEQYRSLVTNIPDVVWSTDRKGNTSFISPNVKDIYGFSPEEIYEKGPRLWLDRIHPDNVESVKEAFELLFTEHQKFDVEYRIQRKDGRWIWLHDKSIVTYKKDGVECADGMFADITEIKQAKEELKRHREELQKLVEDRTAELQTANEQLKQEIAERKLAENQLQRNYETQHVINSLLSLSLEEVALNELFEHALELIFSIPAFAFEGKGCVFLVEENSDILVMKSQKGLAKANQKECARVPFGRCICGRAALSGMVQFSDKIDEHHEIQYKGIAPHGHYCVPIKAKDNALGVLAIYLKAGHRQDQKEEEFLLAVANTLAGITMHKQIEDELRNSEARLAKAQRIAQLGNWEWDIENNKLYWSDEIYNIFGLEPQKFGASYEAFLNCVHPEDRNLVEKSVAEALYEKKPYSIDHHIIMPDGSWRVVHEEAEVAFDETEKPVRMVGTVQDITARTRIEKELRNHRDRLEKMVEERTAELILGNKQLRKEIAERERAEDKLRKLYQAVEQSSSTVVITDTQGKIEYVNSKFTQITGYSAENAVGLNPRILKSGKQPPEFYTKLWDTITSGTEWRGEFCNRKKSGELYWESATIAPVRNPEGEITNFVAVKEDITERKRSEEELRIAKEKAEVANQAKSDFLASMSHELRTPLNAIIGFSEVLRDRYFGKLNEKQTEYANDITEAGKHLLSLINDILDLSKVEAGKMELNLAPVNIKGLLKNSLIMIKEKAMKHGISIDLQIPNEMSNLEILADERKLKQVVFNLLSNAAKFTHDGGAIVVEAKQEEEGLIISISDTGIGISSKDQQKIFEEFYQVRGSTTDKTPGTGLGLPLSKSLVEMHGGKIWVESEGEGQGSRFCFILPLRTEPQDQSISVISKRQVLTAQDADSGLLEKLKKTIYLSLRQNKTFALSCLHAEAMDQSEKVMSLKELIHHEKRPNDHFDMDSNGNFYLILQDTNRDGGKGACNRIARKMQKKVEDLTVSCATAIFPEDGDTPERLIQKVLRPLDENPGTGLGRPPT